MANEAVLRDRLADPIDFTVAGGIGIEKGALLKMTDPRTAAASAASADVMAGIAAREKVASDGRTRLAVYTKGIFDVYACGAIPVGQPVMSVGSANKVIQATTAASGAAIMGYALETAADNEVFQIMLDIGGGGG